MKTSNANPDSLASPDLNRLEDSRVDKQPEDSDEDHHQQHQEPPQ